MIIAVFALLLQAGQGEGRPGRWDVAVTDLLAGYEQGQGDAWRKVRIATPEQWEAKRADIRRRVLDIMGPFPAGGATLAPATLARTDEEGYTRAKVVYNDEAGRPIRAWLLVPKGTGPFPAILAAHPTETGAKDAVVGLAGKAYNHYGLELVRRGFVVLAPDSIAAGERVLPGADPYVTAPFDKANPEWSAMGKMLADHRRGIDYLVSLPVVDGARIGVIGHSLGGYNAFFLAAFEPRVRAAVSSCGFNPMGLASKPFAWARTSWFVHFPRLAPYLRAGILPFDFHEVLALVAPRPLFNYSAARDSIFPDADAIRGAAAQVGEVYRLMGAEDRFVFRITDGPHEFPPAVREEAYGWLARQLGAR